MTTVKKTVRFYDTVVTDENNDRVYPDSTFWSDFLRTVSGWTLEDRTASVYGTEYFGHVRTPLQPATTHLQVERVRSPSEQLNRSNMSNGNVLPLDFDDPNDRVTEPTYIVPFGVNGRVAVLSPAVRATRYETISRWLTAALDLPRQGKSISLIPVVDPRIVDRISEADGAVMLEVHLDSHDVIPEEGGGDVGEAFRKAQQDHLQSANLSFRWSLGRSGGSFDTRDALRKGALWVANKGIGRNSKVKLVEENAEGKLIRDDIRDIIADRITKQVSFEIVGDRRTQEGLVVASINSAIESFMADGEGIGFQDMEDARTVNLEIAPAGREA